MARPQGFKETEVLDTAMHLFWSQGYVATGMARILQDTGLKPGSFYNTFGSKKTLFVRCIEHYIDTVVDARIDRYLTGSDPVAAIEGFFTSACESSPGLDESGCLLTKTATEVGTKDAEINRVVLAGLEKIQAALEARIIEAQERGQVSSDLDPQATALHLLSCYQGMSVIGGLTQSGTKLRSLVRSALQALASAW